MKPFKPSTDPQAPSPPPALASLSLLPVTGSRAPSSGFGGGEVVLPHSPQQVGCGQGTKGKHMGLSICRHALAFPLKWLNYFTVHSIRILKAYF